MTIQEMQQLKNTLALVEVRGQSTIYIADCLKFIDQKIKECESAKESEVEENDKE